MSTLTATSHLGHRSVSASSSSLESQSTNSCDSSFRDENRPRIFYSIETLLALRPNDAEANDQMINQNVLEMNKQINVNLQEQPEALDDNTNIDHHYNSNQHYHQHQQQPQYFIHHEPQTHLRQHHSYNQSHYNQHHHQYQQYQQQHQYQHHDGKNFMILQNNPINYYYNHINHQLLLNDYYGFGIQSNPNPMSVASMIGFNPNSHHFSNINSNANVAGHEGKRFNKNNNHKYNKGRNGKNKNYNNSNNNSNSSNSNRNGNSKEEAEQEGNSTDKLDKVFSKQLEISA